MKRIYFLLISGILFISSSFNNIYAELAFAFIGGIGIGEAIRQSRKRGYNEGFKDGRGY